MKKIISTVVFIAFIINAYSQISINLKAGYGVNNNFIIAKFDNMRTFYKISAEDKENIGYNFVSKPAFIAGLSLNYKRNTNLNFSFEPTFFTKQTYIDNFNLYTEPPSFMDFYERNYYLNIPLFYKLQIINRLHFKIGAYSEFLLKNNSTNENKETIYLSNYRKHNFGLSCGFEVEPIKKLFVTPEFYIDITDYANNGYMTFYNYTFIVSLSYQIFSSKQ